MATVTERQAIPLVNSEAERIFALLDAGKRLGIYHHVSLFAHHFVEGIAEYAIRLWASANSCKLEERNDRYEDGSSIRCIRFDFDPNDLMRGCVSLQWDRVEAPVELREPVPGIVIAVPAEPPAAPTNDNTKPAAALDDSATRFSLLEID
jgi:hypothetical protein